MEPVDPHSLEEQVGELRSRILRLEHLLRTHGIAEKSDATITPGPPHFEHFEQPEVDPTPAATRPVTAPAAPAPPLFARPIAPSRFATVDAAPPGDTRSLESRVGSHWFNRIGILAILIGMAWFLKFAIDNHWIGPTGRVLIGLLAGAGLITWSERFRARRYNGFSYSLKATGSGILYLSLWAAFSLYHLVPVSVAFLAMIAVTAFNGYLAWVQDAELLAFYAIVGGLSTPVLISTGGNHEVTLFSYLLMLDVAVLILVTLRSWSRLLFGAFVGTVFFVAGWWFTFYTQTLLGKTAFFLTCFFLIFALAPRLVRLGSHPFRPYSEWDHLVIVLLPVANAALGFLAFYSLFDSLTAEWAGPWLAVGFAAFYLLLLRLPAAGRLQEAPSVLSSLHLTSAVVFLTIAIPLKAHGRWLTIGWLVEGAALLWASNRIRSKLLRVLALLCLLIGLMALLAVNPDASTVPIFNERFGTHCVAIAVLVFVAWIARRAPHEERQPGEISWPAIATMAGLLINGLILLAVSFEIHSFWWNRSRDGNVSLVHDHRMYAQFTYSAFFMAFGALLLTLGFWRRAPFLRWQALVLLAVTIAKVFLVDISALSQGFRIISFLGLGALLLTVSFAYQRDWLNLRLHRGEAP
jgi:uncharacterized membrane protein